MAWCPKCKNEYVKGISHCPDCDVDLVDELVEEEIIESSPETESVENNTEEEKAQEKPEFVKTYVEASHREEEMKSSSVSFIIVGILLVALIVLVYLDIIPIAVNSLATKILDISVLGAMAFAFFVIAIFSMKRAKQLAVSSTQEVKLTEEILQYCLENYKDSASEDSSETDQYFEREAGIRKLICEQYKGLTPSYLEYLVEIVYNELDF